MEIPAARDSGILNLSALIIVNDIYSNQPENSPTARKFEQLYIASRKREGRIYTDAQVSNLPEIDSTHAYAGEWKVRKRSVEMLIKYLGKKIRPMNILEVGCGNGWLSGRMADIKSTRVLGIDINEIELSQAKRVFGHKTNIQFQAGGLDSVLNKGKFDIVVFAASIQYFRDLRQTIKNCLSLLGDGGEIHILDSPFYGRSELQIAAERSHSYYHSIGYGEMANWYFHHAFDSLEGFRYKKLYDPLRLKSRIFRRNDPFPWIYIQAR